jgi:para-aminobenzoate synthetase component 1
MLLDSSGYPSTYPFLAALDAAHVFYPKTNQSFDELFQWHQQCNDWLFGHISYDVKNEIESLSSSLPDFIKFPVFSFFQPVYIIEIVENKATYHIPSYISDMDAEHLHNEILSTAIDEAMQINAPSFHKRISKKQYMDAFSSIKQHIQMGDIYEMNYCQEFYNEHFTKEPVQCFVSLLHHSPMPFSAYYRHKQNQLLCASPERYIKKNGSQIISQPIKGTVKRGKNQEEDNRLKSTLEQCEKERAENIMIVDLVRNDLSRTAQKNSVEVTELCKVYEFPTVFQMISTIQSQQKQDVKFTDVLKTTFPMGSMTGAPKIRAMELIEKYEAVRRGLFSGTVGYINPAGDFDFNVIIRSLQINTQKHYASFITGGAITIKSDAKQEYEECFVKAQGLLNAFNAVIN